MLPLVGLQGTLQLIEQAFLKYPLKDTLYTKPLWKGMAKGIIDKCKEENIDLSSSSAENILNVTSDRVSRVLVATYHAGPEAVERISELFRDSTQLKDFGERVSRSFITKDDCIDIQRPPPSGGSSGNSSGSRSADRTVTGYPSLPSWIPSKTPKAESQPFISIGISIGIIGVICFATFSLRNFILARTLTTTQLPKTLLQSTALVANDNAYALAASFLFAAWSTNELFSRFHDVV